MSKTVLNEFHPQFSGLYNGQISHPDVNKLIESSDLVFDLGGFVCDTNTGGFSVQIDENNVIGIHSDHTSASTSQFGRVALFKA